MVSIKTNHCIRLATFNIRHAKGLDGKVSLSRTLSVLRQLDADVVALQEVDRFVYRSGFLDQAKILAKELGMNWCFSPSLRLAFMKYGNAILSKYPILQHMNYFLPGSERRSAICAKLRVGDRTLSVVNTHLGLTSEDRRKQMTLMMMFLHSIQGAGVVVGDFNMSGKHPLMHHFIQQWHKADLPDKMATTTSGIAEIDHIFTNSKLFVTHTATLSTMASDHLPVVADMAFAPAWPEQAQGVRSAGM